METATPRKVRADSLRNRERLLAAARRVFAAGGAGASLQAVAREAGFGIGTLYRHFPTREALFLAVYAREADELVALADDLRAHDDPVDALRRWLRASVGMVATKKGMLAVLAPAAGAADALFADTRRRLHGAVGILLDRGVALRRLRGDLEPEDVMRALHGFCYAGGEGDWQPTALRLIDVFVDGMRPPCAP